METEWTFDQPTKEGYYWVEESLKKVEIAKIEKNVWGNLCVSFTDITIPTELSFMKGLRWYGPMTPPPIKLIKEETDEDSNS